MVTAWVGLAPLGVLMARHKWLLGDAKLCGLHLWYRLHMALQLTTLLCTAAGGVLAFVSFSWQGTPGGAVGAAHKYGGIVVLVLSVAQLLVGLIRPKPMTPRRPAWNQLHWWNGRVTLLLAWVVIGMGIYLLTSVWAVSSAAWAVPLGVVLGLYVLADCGLTCLRPPAGKPQATATAAADGSRGHRDPWYQVASQQQQQWQQYPADTGGVQLVQGGGSGGGGGLMAAPHQRLPPLQDFTRQQQLQQQWVATAPPSSSFTSDDRDPRISFGLPGQARRGGEL